MAAQDPGPDDAIGAWLGPALADRIEAFGVRTLFLLAERVNNMGAGWYRSIPAIGAGKAARIVDWLRLHQDTIGVRIGAHVDIARRSLTPRVLASVIAPSTALVPMEKLQIPQAIHGSHGAFRAPLDRCLLDARNDHEAIAAWLQSKRPGKDGSLSPTQRAYRKEAERLLLWATLQRGKALSSLSVEDANAYAAFLLDPPASWCGPRHHQRWSPLWRPLEGPLQPLGQAHALTILRILYGFLIAQGYVYGNPFAAVAAPAKAKRPQGSGRTLSFAHMDFVIEQLDRLDADPATSDARRRMALTIRWLYATGLRLAEIVDSRCGDLQLVEFFDAGQLETGWMQTVVGKGARVREVPVPAGLIAQLSDALRRRGLEPMILPPYIRTRSIRNVAPARTERGAVGRRDVA